MASNQTANYGLCQWEATDAVLRTDFNADNAKIDAALKSQAGSISSLSGQLVNKASSSTVSSLSAKLNQEIQDREEADTAEAAARAAADNTEKAAREAADEAEATARAQGDAALTAALSAGLALKGNVQAEIKTYTGNGNYGANKPNSLTFSGLPLALFIAGVGGYTAYYFRGDEFFRTHTGGNVSTCVCTWNGNTCSWYGGDMYQQLNQRNVTYTVVALLAADE